MNRAIRTGDKEISASMLSRYQVEQRRMPPVGILKTDIGEKTPNSGSAARFTLTIGLWYIDNFSMKTCVVGTRVTNEQKCIF